MSLIERLSVQVHLVCEYVHNRICITEGTVLAEGNTVESEIFTRGKFHKSLDLGLFAVLFLQMASLFVIY